jgi:TonB family protein
VRSKLLALFSTFLMSCTARSGNATLNPTIVTSIRPGYAALPLQAPVRHHKICKPVIVRMGTPAFPSSEIETDTSTPKTATGTTIVIDLIVSATGRPLFKRVHHSSGSPELDAAAVAAAERTIFRPGTLDGRPAAMPFQLEFDLGADQESIPDLLRMPPGIGGL